MKHLQKKMSASYILGWASLVGVVTEYGLEDTGISVPFSAGVGAFSCPQRLIRSGIHPGSSIR
jgi:hypothetical protein